MLNYITSSESHVEIAIGLVFGLFLIFFSQHLFFNWYNAKNNRSPSIKRTGNALTTQTLSSVEDTVAGGDATNIAHHNKTRKLKEITKLHKNEQEFAAGEPGCMPERPQVKKQLSELMRCSESDFANEGDSMVVNLPGDEDPYEIDMADLTPNDISIEAESEEEEEHNFPISPQAIADIEAELLDTSILNESIDNLDGQLSELDPEILLKVVEEFASFTAVSVLNELCIESLVESILHGEGDERELLLLQEEDSDDDIFANNCKIANIVANNSRDCKLRKDESLPSSVNEREGGNRTDDFWLMDEELPSNNCNLRIEVIGQLHANEESERNSSTSCNVLRKERGMEKQASCSQSSVDKIFPPTVVVEKSFNTDSLTSATELVANYLIRKSVNDAVEEIMLSIEEDDAPGARLSDKLDKISKINSEKQKLNEDELAEERRIEQGQLSDILALMERNPQMFGRISRDTLGEQASLYCV